MIIKPLIKKEKNKTKTKNEMQQTSILTQLTPQHRQYYKITSYTETPTTNQHQQEYYLQLSFHYCLYFCKVHSTNEALISNDLQPQISMQQLYQNSIQNQSSTRYPHKPHSRYAEQQKSNEPASLQLLATEITTRNKLTGIHSIYQAPKTNTSKKYLLLPATISHIKPY
jgi:hypothetical protein